MTLRYILVILSFTFSTTVQSQLYRVFFHEKGENAVVNPTYLDMVRSHCDSIWMHSNWLNYALVENDTEPADLLNYEFVDRIEKVVPLSSIPLQENRKDSMDAESLDEHRQWQLDTMGFQFFNSQKIKGTGVVVAIIDAGFAKADESRAFQHIYRANRVLYTYDFIDNDSNVYHGSSHGTSVWGLIGGNLDGKPIGLAPNASFILLRSEDTQTETMADEDRWIQAIEKAYELGADIVNSSIGFTNALHKRSDLNGQTLISKAADMAAKKGMLVVISAGNEWITAWKTLSVPADADGVIAVGGIDKNGKQSYFSSVGPTADGRAKPDVVAPGTCVSVKGSEFTVGSGTSFAAPLVAGYLACMLEWKGKGNFPRDSVKYYGGLYPYFDYVYGFGVPTVYLGDSLDTIPFTYGYMIDKTKGILVEERYKFPVTHKVLLKITDINGFIKFSRRITIPTSCKYKVPRSGAKIPFNYSKCYSFSETDIWSIWDENRYFKF